ncbi:MAG: adenylate/guanylate cyclase domain-containing protein [Dehalococcoidia bacterium]
MEPRIQYAKTSDGVNIAYGEVGEGRPVISMPPPVSGHAELIWETFGEVFRSLATKFHMVSFDARGVGLSDRHALNFSIEALIRDLEAVVARTGFQSFVFIAFASAVPTAVTYTVAHPDRVSHLVLCDAMTSFSDIAETPAYRASVPLLEIDWVLFTDTFAHIWWVDQENPEFGRRFAEYLRACCGPEAWQELYRAWEKYDVRTLLPKVAVPTLVIHNKNNRFFPKLIGQRTAAAIPGARLALIDDLTYAPLPALVEAFVAEGEARQSAAGAEALEAPSGTAVILFADIVDSTALTERLGDTAFRDKARALDATLRTIIREHSGTAIEGKLLGDGVLAVFTSARQAIEAALACGKAGDAAGLPLHLGLHAGDVIREEGNVYGGAVNIASRISGLSAPGEVLVSDTLRGLARTSAGVTFVDRGEQELKGVGEAVRVWAVGEA